MRSSFRDFFTGLLQSFRFHYLWRGFFYDRIYAGIQTLSKKVDRLSALLLVVYTSAVAILITVNGISRIVFYGAVQRWTEELSLWFLTGICFVGSGMAIRKGLHVGITIIIEFAPPCVKRPLVFMGNLFISVFLLCLIAVSFVSALDTVGKTGESLRIPLIIPYMQIPLGCVLIFLQMLPFLAGPLLKDADPEKYLLTRIIPGD
jgi:TRAP-type C4-dicarboxylate transport system permease small subunit